MQPETFSKPLNNTEAIRYKICQIETFFPLFSPPTIEYPHKPQQASAPAGVLRAPISQLREPQRPLWGLGCKICTIKSHPPAVFNLTFLLEICSLGYVIVNKKWTQKETEWKEKLLKSSWREVVRLRSSRRLVRSASEVSTPPILLSIRRAPKDSAGYWKQYTKITAYTLDLTWHCCAILIS